ncbi:MAG: hypothetical protein ABI795_08295, partial [Chthoniobacterales bacterium]
AGRHQHDEAGGEKHEAGSSCVEHKIGVLDSDVYKVRIFIPSSIYSLTIGSVMFVIASMCAQVSFEAILSCKR